MKICVVTQQVGRVFSGPGVHSNNLIHSLVADGHDVWVIAPETQRQYDPIGYHFVGIPKPRLNQNQGRWFFLSLGFARVLKELEQTIDFSIIHFTDAREALFYRSSCPALGNFNDTYSADLRSPLFYRRHFNDWLPRWTYYAINRLLERLALRRLSCILANSQFTAGAIRQHYPEIVSKVEICYKSVDWRKYQPAIEQRHQIPTHPPSALFVGGNMQRKGIRTLIQAAPAVIKELPDAVFTIVGEDPVISIYKTITSRMGVGSHFQFLGWKSQEELITIYAQSDLFVMPSIVEAFGVVFLEAMAAGLPVIGTRVGGIPEIIEDGVNGVLCPPEDPASLSKAIITLIINKQLCKKLSRVGLVTARQYSIEKMMAKTYDIYNKLMRN